MKGDERIRTAVCWLRSLSVYELLRGNCTFREPQDETCPRCRLRRRTGWLWLRRLIYRGAAS